MPVTTPVVGFTVATVPPPLHVPPPGELERVSVLPAQMTPPEVAVIAPGSGLTVTVAVVIQPVAAAVNVTVATPALIPVNTPVVLLIVPTVSGLLLHVPPPAVKFSKVIDDPSHTCVGPVIAAGSG